MPISGDDYDNTNEPAEQPAGRDTPRRRDQVRRLADAIYERAHGRLNPEARQSREYDACLQDAEARTPLEVAPFRDNDLREQGYKRVAEYRYHDINGQVLYFAFRYEHPGVPKGKKFKQCRPAENSPTGLAADAGFFKVPYRWKELAEADPTKPVYWCEGEKDVETCIGKGLVATTAAGQQLSAVIANALKGRNVVVLVDNDSKGEENAAKAAEAFRHYAASLKVVRLPRLKREDDVTDWFEQHGGTVEELNQIVETTPPVRAPELLNDAATFSFQAQERLARREWLYKPAYIRGNVSVTAGAGARGKSTLIVAEALAMASGKAFLGAQPPKPLNVWYVNLEDDMDELRRKFNAAATFHELTPADIADRLYVDSGTAREIVIASEDLKRRPIINHAALEEIRRTIIKRSLDVVIFDPFVSLHRVSENDNGAIDLVVKALAGLAQDAKCAVMLVHHTRKPNGDAGGVDDARGASALVNAARYVRVLNPMTEPEAKGFDLDPDKRGFYFSATDGKTNLTPPAKSRDWFKLESVELGNGGGFETDGDNVGVVTRFAVAASEDADRLRNPTQMDIEAAFRGEGQWRFDVQARSQWAGDQLALSLGVERLGPTEKEALNLAIRRAVIRGWLVKYTAKDRYRMDREWVKLSEAATPSAGDAQNDGDAT